MGDILRPINLLVEVKKTEGVLKLILWEAVCFIVINKVYICKFDNYADNV